MKPGHAGRWGSGRPWEEPGRGLGGKDPRKEEEAGGEGRREAGAGQGQAGVLVKGRGSDKRLAASGVKWKPLQGFQQRNDRFDVCFKETCPWLLGGEIKRRNRETTRGR